MAAVMHSKNWKNPQNLVDLSSHKFFKKEKKNKTQDLTDCLT